MVNSAKRAKRAGGGLFAVVLLAGMFVATSAVAQAVQPAATGEVAATNLAQSDLESQGAALYENSCSTCHQSGGVGVEGTFPPLLGNPNAADAAYVEDTIRNGRQGRIEVAGVFYDDTMPAQGTELSDGEIEAVVAYVVSLSAQSPDSGPVFDPNALPDGVAARGKQLFRGDAALDNGAASCASCHVAGSVGNFGGNSLGPDLTDVSQKLGGVQGLSSWLANPPSATMTPIFSRHPLTPNEIADLVAFFEDTPNQERPSYFGDVLLLGGVAGALILFGGMAIAWRGMRQTYVEKLRSRG